MFILRQNFNFIRIKVKVVFKQKTSKAHYFCQYTKKPWSQSPKDKTQQCNKFMNLLHYFSMLY